MKSTVTLGLRLWDELLAPQASHPVLLGRDPQITFRSAKLRPGYSSVTEDIMLWWAGAGLVEHDKVLSAVAVHGLASIFWA